MNLRPIETLWNEVNNTNIYLNVFLMGSIKFLFLLFFFCQDKVSKLFCGFFLGLGLYKRGSGPHGPPLDPPLE